MKTANFEYKCSRCGEVFEEGTTNEANALQILMSLLFGVPYPYGLIGPRVNKFTMHVCKTDKGMGVATLIGYNVEED